MKNTIILMFSAMLTFLFPVHSYADSNEKMCQQIGVNFWGASWHTQRPNKYNESGNWGLGVRCYVEKNWFGNGKSRSFTQVDMFRNSNWGIAIPISAGTEYEIMDIAGGDCQISAIGAVAGAFYESRVSRKNTVMVGVVPGTSFGCRRVKFNITMVPKAKPDRDLIVVAAASMTFMLEKEGDPRTGKSNFLQVGLDREEVMLRVVVPF